MSPWFYHAFYRNQSLINPPLVWSIHQSLINPPPSGVMFHSATQTKQWWSNPESNQKNKLAKQLAPVLSTPRYQSLEIKLLNFRSWKMVTLPRIIMVQCSVNGCISNSSYHSNIPIFHWTMIMGDIVLAQAFAPPKICRGTHSVSFCSSAKDVYKSAPLMLFWKP